MQYPSIGSWNNDTFLFTSTSGSAASLFRGMTIHEAEFLNGKEKNISKKTREDWRHVHILIIDEIPFFTRLNLQHFDCYLNSIMDRQDKPYGRMSVIFSGDFHQLHQLKCKSHGVLYEGVMNCLFEGSINTAIFLENSYRFNEDPDYGAFMKHVWKGEVTYADIDKLNTRFTGQNRVTLPADTTYADTFHACPFNMQRNSTLAGILQHHLWSGLCPSVDSNELLPKHSIIVEGDIHSSSSIGSTGKLKVSCEIRDRTISTCRDTHVVSGHRSKKIDPCLLTFLQRIPFYVY